jgi:coenzyme F420 hydrogenase subunit beta
MPDLDITSVGLFCKHSFNPKKLKEEVKKLLDVDIDQAEKTQIRGDKFVVQVSGKEYSCNVDQLNNAIEAGCTYCNDFPAMFADLAVGSTGSENGCSTVLVRTEKAKLCWDTIEFTKGAVKKDEIAASSEAKRKPCEEHTAPIIRK